MQQGQRIGRHAGLVQQRNHGLRHRRRLLGRLGGDAVAGHQRGDHLAGEDGQREIPRADADEHATAVQAQLVAFAGGARQRLRTEALDGLAAVVAAEVHRLAHLGHAIGQRLAAFLDEQSAELAQPRFERIGGTLQHCRTLGHRLRAPGMEAGVQTSHRRVDIGTGSQRHAGRLHVAQSREQRLALRDAREVGTRRVAPLGAIQRHRQRLRRRLCRMQRRAEQLFQMHRLVGQLMHEGRVGAVLQQPAHEVGQQVAVFADRRIDAASDRRILQHLAIDPFAHPMETLHLERRIGCARHLQDGRDGAGVVRGELRVDRIGIADQRARAGEVRDVGVLLVREHRVAGQAHLLRALDLAVPIGSLDEPHHEAQAVLARNLAHLVDHIGKVEKDPEQYLALCTLRRARGRRRPLGGCVRPS